jgi:hypothetical protein
MALSNWQHDLYALGKLRCNFVGRYVLMIQALRHVDLKNCLK